MPTPEQAVAHADALHREARRVLQEHFDATGDVHPEYAKTAGETGVAAAKIRAAAAGINDTPEITARTAEVRSNFPKIVARTLLGQPVKGRQAAYSLSESQFAQWKETGEWKGSPRPRGADA